MFISLQRRCLVLDHAQIVYLFDRVSKMANKEKSVWNTYTEIAKKQIPSMSTENLCHLVRALCRVNFYKPSLFTAITKQIDPMSMDPRQRAQLLSDLSNLVHLKPQLAFSLAGDNFSSWRTFDLSLVISALSKAKIRDEHILSKVMDELGTRQDVRPMGLAASVVGCAMLSYDHPTVGTLMEQVPRRLYNFGPRECLNVALALCLREEEVDANLMWALLSRVQPRIVEEKHQVCVITAALQALPNLPSAPFPSQVAEKIHIPVPRIAPPTTTKFQRSAIKILKFLRLNAIEEKKIGPYTVDYFLPTLVSEKFPRGTVLEFDGFKHFYADGVTPQLRAKTWLKYRIFHQVGYRVVQVGYFDWDHKGIEQRHHLLQERLMSTDSNIPLLQGRPNQFAP